jgi:small subunit ribosomal protein S2
MTTELMTSKSATQVTMQDMFQVGAHFGHQTRFWNPKMKPYIFGERHKVHIINLEKTMPLFHDAVNFLSKITANGGKVLFVGTKRAAQDLVREEAVRLGMPYVNHRWLGGMLTNYKTLRQSVKRLRELEKMFEEGIEQRLVKKEALTLRRELEKLERSLGGVKNMAGLPDALFLIDSSQEKIAIQEAKRLGIPVVCIVDTNSSPDDIDYIIPANDDAKRALTLYLKGIGDALEVSVQDAREKAAAREVDRPAHKKPADKKFDKPEQKVHKVKPEVVEESEGKKEKVEAPVKKVAAAAKAEKTENVEKKAVKAEAKTEKAEKTLKTEAKAVKAEKSPKAKATKK